MNRDLHDEDDGAQLDIVFTSPGPSPTEIAAVTAVLAAVIDEGSSDAKAPDVGPSAWQRSQRKLRSPVVPGPGAWRSFSADNG
jgi:uncharacterized protein (DUF1800 family)